MSEISDSEVSERLLDIEARQWKDEAVRTAALIQRYDREQRTGAIRDLLSTLTGRDLFALVTVCAVLTRDTDFTERP